MKNIRNNVFETNSSSTHSISIAPTVAGLYDTLPVDSNGKIRLVGGEFGWEWAKFNDPYTKANYAAVFAHEGTPQMVDMLVNVIKEHTGAKEVEFGFTTELRSSLDAAKPGEDNSVKLPWAYIDHQSGYREGGDAMKAFDTPKTLKDFIFNPDSWLFTGNDNSGAPSNFYDVEFGIEYTHQLEMEGSDLVEKFQEYPSDEALQEALERVSDGHSIYAEGERYNYDDKFKLCRWEKDVETGKEISSFDSIKEGYLTFYKTEWVYAEDDRKFLGVRVKDSRKLPFKIVKI